MRLHAACNMQMVADSCNLDIVSETTLTGVISKYKSSGRDIGPREYTHNRDLQRDKVWGSEKHKETAASRNLNLQRVLILPGCRDTCLAQPPGLEAEE